MNNEAMSAAGKDAAAQHKPPKISVIVPVHNGEDFLPACIDSILAQTFRDFELLIVDNGSGDGTPEICTSFASRDPRVRPLRLEESGVSLARNAGMRECRGTFITFIDADDVIEPQMLSFMADHIRPGDDALFCGFSEDFPGGNSSLHLPSRRGIATGPEALLDIYGKTMQACTTVWSKLYRRDALMDGTRIRVPFPEKAAIYEDELWLIRFCLSAGRIRLAEYAGYHWKVRSSSAVHRRYVSPSTDPADFLRSPFNGAAVKGACLRALEEAEGLRPDFRKRLRGMLRARHYRYCVRILAEAYACGNRPMLKCFFRKLPLGRRDYYCSRLFALPGKCKHALAVLLIRLHAPAQIPLKIIELRN